jgi:hypothetical protein
MILQSQQIQHFQKFLLNQFPPLIPKILQFQKSQKFQKFHEYLKMIHQLQTFQMNPQILKKYLLLRHLQIHPNHFLQLLFVQFEWLFC